MSPGETCHRDDVSSGGNTAAGVFTSFPERMADERQTRRPYVIKLINHEEPRMFASEEMTREDAHKQASMQMETQCSPRFSLNLFNHTEVYHKSEPENIFMKDPFRI